MIRDFIAMWCSDGLECIIDVTDLLQQDLVNILKTGQPHKSDVNQYLTMMIIRARYNMQRHYEIYTFSAEDGITKEMIEQMFEDDAQEAADNIRRIGQKVYSDRTNTKPKII